MIILVSGGCKNGKSSYAQKLAVELSKNSAGKAKQSTLIYFATMIPQDSEDDERILKHREDRNGLGFTTVECGKNISEAAKNLDEGSVVLFDSLTALVANEMFSGGVNFPVEDEDAYEKKISQKIQDELKILMEKAASVVFVSDSIFSDGRIYDETTELYRRILAKTENFVAKNSDRVVEMVTKLKIENGKLKIRNSAGEKLTREEKIPQHENLEAEKTNFQFSTFNFQLIIGGAYQGKTEWAKAEFSLSDDDIFVCTQESEPDFSKKCLSHYENYVAYCLKNKLSPKTDFSDSIIICDDIFCGVVPVDSFQRRLREATGIALQKIAEKANVTRIFCGKAQRIS